MMIVISATTVDHDLDDDGGGHDDDVDGDADDENIRL